MSAPDWELPYVDPPDWSSGAAPPPPAPPAAATLSSLGTPATPADAPMTISIPEGMNEEWEEAWTDSFPGGRAQEQGGTLVRDRNTGEVTMINVGSGEAGSFQPDRTVGPDQEILGAFHTHPYDPFEGGDTNVSLSGGDAGYQILSGDSVIVAQSGEGQFMFVRTDQTPATVDYDAVNDANNARVSELTQGGMTFEAASQQAARETAASLNMAYYEGQDGQFRRVSP